MLGLVQLLWVSVLLVWGTYQDLAQNWHENNNPIRSSHNANE